MPATQAKSQISAYSLTLCILLVNKKQQAYEIHVYSHRNSPIASKVLVTSARFNNNEHMQWYNRGGGGICSDTSIGKL